MKSIVTGEEQFNVRSQSAERRMDQIIEEEDEDKIRVSDKLIDAEDIEKSEEDEDSFVEDEDLREEMKDEEVD